MRKMSQGATGKIMDRWIDRMRGKEEQGKKKGKGKKAGSKEKEETGKIKIEGKKN